MAAADYRLCDLCDRKTFYDADLADDYADRVGDWAVICPTCAGLFKVVVVPKDMVVDVSAAVTYSAECRRVARDRFMALCEEARKKREASAPPAAETEGDTT